MMIYNNHYPVNQKKNEAWSTKISLCGSESETERIQAFFAESEFEISFLIQIRIQFRIQ